MPKQETDIRKFLLKARGDEKTKAIAKSLRIKRTGKVTKFKLRCARYLYTLVMDDPAKAEKIKKAIPTSLKTEELKG